MLNRASPPLLCIATLLLLAGFPDRAVAADSRTDAATGLTVTIAPGWRFDDEDPRVICKLVPDQPDGDMCFFWRISESPQDLMKRLRQDGRELGKAEMTKLAGRETGHVTLITREETPEPRVEEVWFVSSNSSVFMVGISLVTTPGRLELRRKQLAPVLSALSFAAPPSGAAPAPEKSKVAVEDALEMVFARYDRPTMVGGLAHLRGAIQGKINGPDGSEDVSVTFHWSVDEGLIQDEGDFMLPGSVVPFVVPEYDFFGNSALNPESAPDRYEATLHTYDYALRTYVFQLVDPTTEEREDVGTLLIVSFGLDPSGGILESKRTMGSGFDHHDVVGWSSQGEDRMPCALYGRFSSVISTDPLNSTMRIPRSASRCWSTGWSTAFGCPRA